MARPVRIEFPGAFYHVICRGNERKPIYRDARDREGFLARLGAVAERHRVRGARRPERLPVVLTGDEVQALLAALDGVAWIMAVLLYGAGLRLMGCLRLRVNDIEFTRNAIVVREGKGNKDRVTMLPGAVKRPLQTHLQRVRERHSADLLAGYGRVQMPDAPAAKCPSASRAWA